MNAARQEGSWGGNLRPDPSFPGNCVYVYSSTPHPMEAWGRPKFRNNMPYPRGIGDFYNVMWDPRVCRGAGNKQPQKNFIECFNVRKPRAVVRKPKFVYVRPPTPPRERRENYENKAENHMEELNPHLIEDEKAIVDIEATFDLPSCPSSIVPYTGRDAATQILDGDLFDFDQLVIPVGEALVGQVVERSIIELLEEEELEALRVQQTNFESLRLKEQKKLLALREQNDRLEDERIRVAEEAEEYLKTQKEASHRIEAVAFSSLYLGGALKDIKAGLKLSTTLAETQTIIFTVFNPWINKFVESEISQLTMCRNLLDDVILSMVGRREADYFLGKWDQDQANALAAHPPDYPAVHTDYSTDE